MSNAAGMSVCINRILLEPLYAGRSGAMMRPWTEMVGAVHPRLSLSVYIILCSNVESESLDW